MNLKDFKIIDCDESYLMSHANEFSELCVSSFAEHANKDIRMGPCTMTTEKWRTWAIGCIGQCVLNNDRMIAFWLAKPNYEKKEAEGRILAVDPEYKGHHLGLALVHARTELLRLIGMNIYNTDTSIKATHVVNFHKSYGCKVVGLASWNGTNYYSVLLRLALYPEYEISDEEASRRFKRSAKLCKMQFKENGSRTLVGYFYFVLIRTLSIVKRIVNKFLK